MSAGQNDFFALSVPGSGVTDGHIHFDLHATDPDAIAVTGVCANVVASLLFERLGAQGSNIICTLSADRGVMDVLLRGADDGLGLVWEPVQMDAQRLNEAQAKIQDKTFVLTHKKEDHLPQGHEQKPSHPAKQPTSSDGHGKQHHEEGHGHHLSEEEEEAYVKQITRIP